MTSRETTWTFFFAFSVLSISCHDRGVEATEGGQGIIVPGKSIDGVFLGDSREEVEGSLGEPTAKGDAEGIYRGWFTYAYLEGEHAGLHIYFIDIESSYGRVDLVTVLAPYSGKTKEGIGLGSQLVAVHQIYGVPRRTLVQPSRDWIADFYCFGGRTLELHYEDSLVSTLSIGYYVPMEQDTLYSCE
jgi:hypothetical protein